MIPIPHRYALAAVALAGLYLAGYIHGRTSTRDELTAWQSVATATQTRHRTLEKEVADAQAAHVKVWTAARDASRAEWVRLKAGVDRGVPALRNDCGRPEADPKPELGGASAPITAGEVGDAFEAGRAISDELDRCQFRLSACSQLR